MIKDWRKGWKQIKSHPVKCVFTGGLSRSHLLYIMCLILTLLIHSLRNFWIRPTLHDIHECIYSVLLSQPFVPRLCSLRRVKDVVCFSSDHHRHHDPNLDQTWHRSFGATPGNTLLSSPSVRNPQRVWKTHPRRKEADVSVQSLNSEQNLKTLSFSLIWTPQFSSCDKKNSFSLRIIKHINHWSRLSDFRWKVWEMLQRPVVHTLRQKRAAESCCWTQTWSSLNPFC